MIYGSVIRGVNLFRIVATATNVLHHVVRKMLNHLQHFRISTEEVLADVSTVRHRVLLVLAVNDFAHAFDQPAVLVLIEQCIPIRSPDDFDHVPASASESGFQFLNNLAVAANRAVKSLQVAVDDPG